MAGLSRRKKNMAKNKEYRKARRTKRYKRDIDQIVLVDMEPKRMEALEHQPLDETKPGMGQFYCVTCSRYMISEKAMQTHLKMKEHKKRVKVCKEPVYTQKEADWAAGLQS
jgi:bud site selection protein 20